MNAAARRLLILKQLLAHVRERLELDLGFKLWDGSTVPADYSPDALTVSIADEGAIAALLRRPKIDTLANLYAAGRIDLLNGTFFDLVARRPKIKTKLFVKALDKRLVFDVLRQFLFVPRGGPWPLEAIKADRPSRHEFAEDKANIHHHYDASNEFYALWLDREMVYTCAYFHDWDQSLEDAQRNKLDLVCRKLRLKAGETLLDLGCGWGSLVIHAAQHYGAKAYGVTLAEEQARYAQEKIERLGLGRPGEGRVPGLRHGRGRLRQGVGDLHSRTRRREEFRDVLPNGASFVEAGRLLSQPIDHPAGQEGRADLSQENPDYAALTRYVFPGAELDYIGRTITNLERYGFEVHDVEGWREHYQLTCKIWHDRLLANRAEAERLVGPVTTRVWLAYLAGVSIAFERSTALVFQTLASKRRRGPSGLPPTRADLYR